MRNAIEAFEYQRCCVGAQIHSAFHSESEMRRYSQLLCHSPIHQASLYFKVGIFSLLDQDIC